MALKSLLPDLSGKRTRNAQDVTAARFPSASAEVPSVSADAVTRVAAPEAAAAPLRPGAALVEARRAAREA